MLARDVMDTRFHLLRPSDTLNEAVRVFAEASRGEGRKIFGLMVVDDDDHLAGMLSMYDILLFIQPKYMKIWGEMEDIDLDLLFPDLLEKARSVRVGDIMTTEVVTTGPDSHILAVADVMVKRHIRRLPVTENGRIIGIIYISTIFNQLLNGFLTPAG